ncbi:MAG: hypothetical protein HYW49_00660 [Deltaproteobacteria bacterium]|nr:hypothetical protein [Deltaproteobacteria bacterium]
MSDRTEGRYDFALLHEHGSGHSGAFESSLSVKHGIYRSGPMSAAMMVSGGADKIYGSKPFYAVMLRAPLTVGDETIEATVSPWARKGFNEVVARELGVSPAVGIDAGFALHLIERLDLLFESRLDFSYGKDSNSPGLASGLEYRPLERATLQLAFYEKPVGRGPAVGLVAVRAHIALAAL